MGSHAFDYIGRGAILTPDLNTGPFGHRNRLIGGDFGTNPWQRGTSFVAAANGIYTADRWSYNNSSAVVNTVSQDSSSVPSVAQVNRLVTNCLLVTTTTSEAVVGAGDAVYIRQPIEGFNFQSIAQRGFTLSFWHAHTVTGTYCISVQNGGLDRAFIGEYTQVNSNAWEYAEIQVPASPSAGTWFYDNRVGLYVNLVLLMGSTFQTPAGSWTTGQLYASANQVNACATNGNTNRFALVQIEPGIIATPYENVQHTHLLELCQRYYEKSFAIGTTPAQNVGANTGEPQFVAIAAGALSDNSAIIPFKVRKRATAPTMTSFNPSAANAQVRDLSSNLDCSGTVLESNTETGFRARCTGNAGTSVGNILGVHWTASSEL